ncbi:MAG TPA: AraC family transcriptional regulator [Beijerinckiaceae bacterium]|nr:AraC family transcriptional regulator [Beijerinckiaceae bacterium]
MPAHGAAASPLPPSAEGRITRLAAAHVQASCDLKNLLARAGLRLKDLEDARARIGVQNQITFLELASKAMDDPLLGFHLAQTFEPRELGLLYYVQASCATLAEALGCMARYISVAHEGLDATCVTRDGLKLRISYVGVPRHADRQQMEALVTILIRIARQLTDHHIHPTRVGLAHPRDATSAEFESFVGSTVDFSAGRDEIAFSAAAINLRIASADPYLNESLVSYWEAALAGRSRRRSSIKAAVENAILPLLPHGKARIGRVAEDLGVSSRTLSRRLATEGLAFAQVLDGMRTELAEGYLKDRSLSIAHIAWLLGFQEASAFTHAYKRWTGKPPTERRRMGLRHRSSPSAS